jgi:hypothetical protein
VTDDPYVENANLPYPHHPVLSLPRVNTTAESDVFRLFEGHEQRLADWCGGTVVVEDTALAVEVGGATARVGDYVVRTYGDEGPPWYVVVPAEMYQLIWWPKGHVPDWEWRCYQPWEPQPDRREPTHPALGPDDFPAVHHPIDYLPWLDTAVEVQVHQHRAGLSEELAQWCGGSVSFTDQLVVLVPDAVEEDVLNPAGLGDFVLLRDGVFHVERPDGFFLRYWPIGRDPGYSFKCFYQGSPS